MSPIGTTPAVFSVLAEIEWDFDGRDEDVNWLYLHRHATLVHREAGEYVLHIGQPGDEAYWNHVEREMRGHGCTEPFIAAYLAAKDAGAVRALFWGCGWHAGPRSTATSSRSGAVTDAHLHPITDVLAATFEAEVPNEPDPAEDE